MASMRTRRVATFEASCRRCGQSFALPMLSDHEWGEFIAAASRGAIYAYLDSYTEPAWDRIAVTVKRSLGATASAEDVECAIRVVVGKCMDLVEGQELSIANRPVCPACGAPHVVRRPDERVGTMDVPVASFEAFASLSIDEQDEVTRRHLSAWERSRGGA